MNFYYEVIACLSTNILFLNFGFKLSPNFCRFLSQLVQTKGHPTWVFLI